MLHTRNSVIWYHERGISNEAEHQLYAHVIARFKDEVELTVARENLRKEVMEEVMAECRGKGTREINLEG